MIDWLAMSTVGNSVQNATWRQMIENEVAESGGSAPDGVQFETATLDGADAEQVEEWLRRLAEAQQRERNDV